MASDRRILCENFLKHEPFWPNDKFNYKIIEIPIINRISSRNSFQIKNSLNHCPSDPQIFIKIFISAVISSNKKNVFRTYRLYFNHALNHPLYFLITVIFRLSISIKKIRIYFNIFWFPYRQTNNSLNMSRNLGDNRSIKSSVDM